jgi:hypothetical protein
MLRVLPICDKNVTIDPPKIIPIAQNTSTQILPDYTNLGKEYSNRYIQNVGGSTIQCCIDQDCDGVNYHFLILSGNGMDCTPFGLKRVTAWCSVVGGSSVSTIMARREDIQVHPNIKMS